MAQGDRHEVATYQINELRLIGAALSYADELRAFSIHLLQSNRQLYINETRESASRLARVLRGIARVSPSLDKEISDCLRWGPDITALAASLEEWFVAERDEQSIDTSREAGMLLAMLHHHLACRVAGPSRPLIMRSSEEERFKAKSVKWSPFLPWISMLEDPDVAVSRASNTESISVVADIRRSQDLMTFADSGETFYSYMRTFIERTQELAQAHDAVFDKFTGDGFLVHFNDELRRNRGKSKEVRFLEFCLGVLEFASRHFASWLPTLRRLPSIDIGLAIGADIGQVAFFEQRGHLIAVGHSVVWAQRMSQLASANEVVINNKLLHSLPAHVAQQCVERLASLKDGDQIRGFLLKPFPPHIL